MNKIAIIIPCYNEEKRLNQSHVFDLLNKTDVDVFFANDGSKDKTIKVLTKIEKENIDRVKILNYVKNEGKANTIYKSINHINELEKYDYIGYFDADFSTPVSEMIRILHYTTTNKPTLIFGSRIKLLNSSINRKWQRHIIGRVVITILNFRFKLGIYDTQCGAKLVSKKIIPIAFSSPFVTSWLFDVEMFIRLKKQNLLEDAKEFPLLEWKDVEGSKLGWKSAFKILKEMSLLNKKY